MNAYRWCDLLNLVLVHFHIEKWNNLLCVRVWFYPQLKVLLINAYVCLRSGYFYCLRFIISWFGAKSADHLCYCWWHPDNVMFDIHPWNTTFMLVLWHSVILTLNAVLLFGHYYDKWMEIFFVISVAPENWDKLMKNEFVHCSCSFRICYLFVCTQHAMSMALFSASK